MFLQINFTPEVETLRYSIAYIAIFLVVLVGCIFFLTNIFINFLKKKKKSDLIDPNRNTTKKDIQTIGDILKLTQEEKDLLWNICERQSVKNLYIELKNEKFIDSILKKEFELYKQDDNFCAILFSIRNKIDVYRNSGMTLNSSKLIPANQKMTLIVNEDRYDTSVVENTNEGLILLVPKDILGNEINIPTLTKINLLFSMTNNVAYNMQTRIMRYQTRNLKEIVVTHSNNIEIVHRRNFTRISFNTECIFSAVQVTTGGDKKEVQVEYKPLEKKHIGKISDISAEGCCLETELPIKPNQYIYIEVEILEGKTSKIFGKIVAVEVNNSKNKHILHINFVKIDKKTKNLIYSFLYNY